VYKLFSYNKINISKLHPAPHTHKQKPTVGKFGLTVGKKLDIWDKLMPFYQPRTQINQSRVKNEQP
jgi:hypothetical protein